VSWVQAPLRDEERRIVIQQAVERVRDLPLDVLRRRERLTKQAELALVEAAARVNRTLPRQELTELTTLVVSQVGGLGFINRLLPPVRNDLIEIAVNPDGSVWIWRKNARYFERTDLQPDIQEVWRAVDALLAPIGRTISEAEPQVTAKLPRFAGSGGARVQVMHPIIAPGNGYPAISIRLFEPKPVPPEQIVRWQMTPQFVMDQLLEAVARGYRILIIGGTVSGKTTFLSALCNGIPRQARVIKVEDPEEIWLDHPHVVTLETRPVEPGSSVRPVHLKDLIDSSMRMAPTWLIVGEVRTGEAGLALFRAQMSDHPGLSTFHARSPEDAVTRMAVLLMSDSGLNLEAALLNFARSVDLVVQVGWRDGLRRVIGIWQTDGILNCQDGRSRVAFKPLYRLGDRDMQPAAEKYAFGEYAE